MENDFERKLDFLRKNTILGPFAILKIDKLRKESEEFRKWYLKMEGELIDIDYSMADNLEYDLRFRVWENGLARDWMKYGDGLGLSEFADLIMVQNMGNEVKLK